MTALLTIVMVVIGIIALFLIIALFTRKKYSVQSEVIINAPRQKVFDYIKLLRNQDNFNKWVMVDPNMKKEFKGTDGTVGFIYGWDGNKKAGAGEQEITAITEGKNVESEIRFVRPFAGIAHVNLETEPVTENQTKVRWSNESIMTYPMNAMVSMIEKMLVKDMNSSLTTLKSILEK